MEEKVMTLEELADYASSARKEYEKEVRCKKDENVRKIIKTIIDKVKAQGVVMITETGDAGTLYLNASKIEETENISVKDINKAIDSIPALSIQFKEEEKRLFVTFRCSKINNE